MAAHKNIVELRQLLLDRFPHLRLSAQRGAPRDRWPTGVARVDALLRGGLPRGAMTELIGSGRTGGTAVLVHALLQQVARSRQLAALVDGADSFDATALEQPVLSRLLWVRCTGAAMALKAADILLRDRNLPLVILDLKMSTARELRKISATTWHRWQRILEQGSTAFLIVTPQPMVGGAEHRIEVKNRFSLEDLEREPSQLLEELVLELLEDKAGGEKERLSQPA